MDIRRTALATIAAVVLLPAAAAARPASQPSWSTVEVPTGGFSIEVPNGWATATSAQPEALARLNAVLQRSAQDAASLVSADARRQGVAIMDVAVERQFDNPTPSALGRAIASAFEQATKTPMTLTDETLPAGKAVVLRASLKVATQRRSVAIYLFLRGGVAYLVSYVTSHPEDKALIAHSARSFTLLAPPDLSGAILRPAQIGAGYKLREYDLGRSVIGQETLDLCAGTFPSEALRTGRLQVTYLPPKRHVALSNEIVTYVAGGSTQALQEVDRVLTTCSRHPVVRGKGRWTA